MKKTITKLFLVGLLGLSGLNASELLFDLRAQDYANVLKDDVISSKYKISDKIIFETNLQKSSSGVYYYINDTNKVGFSNLEIKSKLNNWTFNSNIIYQSYDWNKGHSIDKKRLIKFIDKDGNVLILEFYRNGFNINGKEFKGEIDGEQLALTVSKQGQKVSFNMNGYNIYDIDNIKFKELHFINTDIWNTKLYDKSYDRLQELKLYSND